MDKIDGRRSIWFDGYLIANCCSSPSSTQKRFSTRSRSLEVGGLRRPPSTSPPSPAASRTWRRPRSPAPPTSWSSSSAATSPWRKVASTLPGQLLLISSRVVSTSTPSLHPRYLLSEPLLSISPVLLRYLLAPGMTGRASMRVAWNAWPSSAHPKARSSPSRSKTLTWSLEETLSSSGTVRSQPQWSWSRWLGGRRTTPSLSFPPGTAFISTHALTKLIHAEDTGSSESLHIPTTKSWLAPVQVLCWLWCHLQPSKWNPWVTCLWSRGLPTEPGRLRNCFQRIWVHYHHHPGVHISRAPSRGGSSLHEV